MRPAPPVALRHASFAAANAYLNKARSSLLTKNMYGPPISANTNNIYTAHRNAPPLPSPQKKNANFVSNAALKSPTPKQYLLTAP